MNKAYVTVALAALALSACSGGEESGPPSSTSGATVPGHVHGLGADPDGRLYIATHEGIYTTEAQGKAVPVGESRDDFMGFTVAPDGAFYASGHPAPDAAGPPNKGLIKSTDSGRTWTVESLAGESDLHAMEYGHDRLYAYDATNGLLRTSEDGATWKDGAQLQALDIAVSPADPDVVLATTEQGIARSADRGASFAPGPSLGMAFISWNEERALYGVDMEGALHRSADGGATWNKAGTVPGGQPQALTTLSDDRVLAATQNGVYETRDAGKTFTRLLALTPS